MDLNELNASRVGSKLEQAAQQVLDALVRSNHGLKENPDKWPCTIEDNEEAITALREALAEQAEQEPVAWQGAEEWEQLAFQLCADENGEESCNELLWDGGVIPEPWGERWLKYEDEAKRMIEYVRKYAAPVRTKDLTDDEISDAIHGKGSPLRLHDYAIRDFRAVIAADREKNRAGR